MKLRSHIGSSTLAGIILLVSSSLASAQDTADDVRLIAFDQEHPLIDMDSSSPLVEVFASGRVVVNRPPVMTNAGIFELVASDDELAQIISLILMS